MKILKFKMSGIGIIAEFRGILSGFPNQGREGVGALLLSSSPRTLAATLPLLVDCCFLPLPWTRGGLGPSLAPPIQRTHPSDDGAAELLLPQWLSLRLLATNFGKNPLQVHVRLGWGPGGVGGQGCLSLTRFPSWRPWFWSVLFVM
jgi:hypothetical protein